MHGLFAFDPFEKARLLPATHWFPALRADRAMTGQCSGVWLAYAAEIGRLARGFSMKHYV
jgi:hypothetical protein